MENRHADVEGSGWDRLGESDWHTQAMCETDSRWEPAIRHRKLSLMPCDDLPGRDRGRVGGGYMHTRGSFHVVPQKLTAVILQQETKKSNSGSY